MRHLLLVVLCCVGTLMVSAQQESSVFTKNGSVYRGTIIQRDSAAKVLKIKVQGGSVFALSYQEVDSICIIRSGWPVGYGKPYWSLGFGSSVNTNRSIAQLDVVAGYRFNSNWSVGIGYAITENNYFYATGSYTPWHFRSLSAGFISCIGNVQAQWLNNWWYGSSVKTTGLYTANGITARLQNAKGRSFSINLGYQYAQVKSRYYNWSSADPITNINYLNRYLIQGVYSF